MKYAAIAEKRREQRLPAQGPVWIHFDNPQSIEIEGRLVDVSPSGFRMSHGFPSLAAGQKASGCMQPAWPSHWARLASITWITTPSGFGLRKSSEPAQSRLGAVENGSPVTRHAFTANSALQSRRAQPRPAYAMAFGHFRPAECVPPSASISLSAPACHSCRCIPTAQRFMWACLTPARTCQTSSIWCNEARSIL